MYQKPTKRGEVVKPGPGPEDLMHWPIGSKEELLELATRRLNEPGLDIVRKIYRYLGSPRSLQLGGEQVLLELWQLGGEQVLRELDTESLRLLAGGARKLLAEMEPGHRYLPCLDYGLHLGGPWPEKDLTNPEIIEKVYSGETIPIEFIERIAALA